MPIWYETVQRNWRSIICLRASRRQHLAVRSVRGQPAFAVPVTLALMLDVGQHVWHRPFPEREDAVLRPPCDGHPIRRRRVPIDRMRRGALPTTDRLGDRHGRRDRGGDVGTIGHRPHGVDDHAEIPARRADHPPHQRLAGLSEQRPPALRRPPDMVEQAPIRHLATLPPAPTAGPYRSRTDSPHPQPGSPGLAFSARGL